MPRSRSDAVTANGATSIRVPGAYLHALHTRCEEQAHMSMPEYLTLADAEIPAWEREKAARVAALMAERTGRPTSARSADLPSKLPAPFDNWPVGRQRTFTVDVDDTITLRTGGVFR
jgi:hypothetical protein